MMSTFEIIQLFVLAMCFVLDTTLLFLDKRKGYLIQHQYYQFHKEYGLLKLSFFKLLFIYQVSDAFLYGTFRLGTILACIVAYCVLITILAQEYIRAIKGKSLPSDSTEKYG